MSTLSSPLLPDADSSYVDDAAAHLRADRLRRSVVLLATGLFLLVPLVWVQLPYGPEQAKVTDVLGVGTLLIAVLLGRYHGRDRRIMIATFAAVGYTIVAYCLAMAFSPQPRVYLSELPRLGRFVAMFGPVIAVATLPRTRRSLSSVMMIFGIIATTASLAMAAAYHMGIRYFDAHQTYRYDGGELFARLGGLVGETGGYAFTALLGFQLLLVAIAMRDMRRCFWVSMCLLMPAFLAIVYVESLVRVSLLNALAFVCGVLLLIPWIGRTRRTFLAFAIGLGIVVWGVGAMAGIDALEVHIERVQIQGGMNQLSSGRFEHWVNGLRLLTESPWAFLFGVGYFAPVFVLGHPIENAVVFHLASFGVIGTLCHVGFYGVLLAPLFKQARRGDAASAVMVAIWAAALMQWQVNDINLYYQAFPALLIFTGWLSVVPSALKDSPLELASDIDARSPSSLDASAE